MKRSKFSLSHYKLLTCDMGALVPIGLTEVLPGDTIQQSTQLLLRVSPLISPVMHPVRVRVHHWFVPHRLVWDQWEDFITGGPDGMDASQFPTLNTGSGAGNSVGDLADYLGVPPVQGHTVSALPFRGYGLIWNEWYRDQDLQGERTVSRASGFDSSTNIFLTNCSWEKDYFTSARPWTQKGPDVSVPIASVAPVEYVPNTVSTADWIAHNGASGALAANGNLQVNNGQVQDSGGNRVAFDPQGRLLSDLTQAEAININELRRAFALQRYEEARARYGSRYTEYLRYLGVRSSDARLQRPEYLGGGKATIQFSEVLQTGPGGTPGSPVPGGVGQLAGHGIGGMRSNRYRRFFEEHGYIFSLLSVLPRTMYSQGIPRTFNRRVKEDFFQKELQHIGQQEVLNKELYATHSLPDGTFGYQDRYDEYRRSESTIAAEFRNTLDFWHYGRIFANEPSLNSEFVSAVPTKRVNQVTSEDCLWIMANHSIQARRLVAGSGKSFIY